MNSWLVVVADFLGCEVSALNPSLIYAVTCGLIAVFVFSIAYVLARCGRK